VFWRKYDVGIDDPLNPVREKAVEFIEEAIDKKFEGSGKRISAGVKLRKHLLKK